LIASRNGTPCVAVEQDVALRVEKSFLSHHHWAGGEANAVECLSPTSQRERDKQAVIALIVHQLFLVLQWLAKSSLRTERRGSQPANPFHHKHATGKKQAVKRTEDPIDHHSLLRARLPDTITRKKQILKQFNQFVRYTHYDSVWIATLPNSSHGLSFNQRAR
jgi:hypothetical protein